MGGVLLMSSLIRHISFNQRENPCSMKISRGNGMDISEINSFSLPKNQDSPKMLKLLVNALVLLLMMGVAYECCRYLYVTIQSYTSF